MTLPKRIPKRAKRTERLRCPGHLKFVRSFRCCVPGCALEPIEAAHVRIGTDGSMGAKPSDVWAISLCAAHHRSAHTHGEATFERDHHIDMKALAREFAAASPALKRYHAKLGG